MIGTNRQDWWRKETKQDNRFTSKLYSQVKLSLFCWYLHSIRIIHLFLSPCPPISIQTSCDQDDFVRILDFINSFTVDRYSSWFIIQCFSKYIFRVNVMHYVASGVTIEHLLHCSPWISYVELTLPSRSGSWKLQVCVRCCKSSKPLMIGAQLETTARNIWTLNLRGLTVPFHEFSWRERFQHESILRRRQCFEIVIYFYRPLLVEYCSRRNATYEGDRIRQRHLWMSEGSVEISREMSSNLVKSGMVM